MTMQVVARWKLPMPNRRALRANKPSAVPRDAPTATDRVASYTVYPTGYDQVIHPEKERWLLTIADAGNGWAIRRGNQCLNIALQWEDERAPELGDSQFLRRCRYNEHAALLRARRVVDRLEVNGLTFPEFANLVMDNPTPTGQQPPAPDSDAEPRTESGT